MAEFTEDFKKNYEKLLYEIDKYMGNNVSTYQGLQYLHDVRNTYPIIKFLILKIVELRTEIEEMKCKK